MKLDERDIRTAMDRRLGSICSDAVRRSRIWQRIEQEKQTHMKKRLTLTVAVALGVLLLATAAS